VRKKLDPENWHPPTFPGKRGVKETSSWNPHGANGRNRGSLSGCRGQPGTKSPKYEGGEHRAINIIGPKYEENLTYVPGDGVCGSREKKSNP